MIYLARYNFNINIDIKACASGTFLKRHLISPFMISSAVAAMECAEERRGQLTLLSHY